MSLREPKIVIDIGRGLLTILLSLAAVFIALAELELTKDFVKALYLLSVLCLVLTARLIDWMLDRISAESWAKVLNRDDIEEFKLEFFKWDGFLFRLKIYANSYLAFTILVGIFAAFGITEFIGFFQSTSSELVIGFLKLVSGITIFVYMTYQMLTIKSSLGTEAFLAIVGILISLLVFVQFN